MKTAKKKLEDDKGKKMMPGMMPKRKIQEKGPSKDKKK
jgi:hypothetical protein